MLNYKVMEVADKIDRIFTKTTSIAWGKNKKYRMEEFKYIILININFISL